jgi:hypothetical protein
VKGARTRTTEQKIIQTKVGVLELAKQRGNVSKAYQLGGEAALQEIFSPRTD